MTLKLQCPPTSLCLTVERFWITLVFPIITLSKSEVSNIDCSRWMLRQLYLSHQINLNQKHHWQDKEMRPYERKAWVWVRMSRAVAWLHISYMAPVYEASLLPIPWLFFNAAQEHTQLKIYCTREGEMKICRLEWESECRCDPFYWLFLFLLLYPDFSIYPQLWRPQSLKRKGKWVLVIMIVWWCRWKVCKMFSLVWLILSGLWCFFEESNISIQ